MFAPRKTSSDRSRHVSLVVSKDHCPPSASEKATMPAGLVLLTLAFRQEGMFVAATDLPTRIIFASDRLEFVSESLRKMPNQKAKSCSTTRISENPCSVA